MSENFISRDDAERDLLFAAAFIGERVRTADGQAESMAAVVPLFLARGEVDLAAELANTVDDPFTRDQLIVSVAQKCAELKDDEYALQLVEAIEDDGMRMLALERLGIAKAAEGEFEIARKVAAEMRQPDFVEAAIAASESETVSVDEAIARVDEIEFPSARVQAFQQIAGHWIENSRSADASIILEHSSRSADEIEHREEQVRAICETGNLFISADRRDLAVETFQKARELAGKIESSLKDYSLGTCALGLLRSGSDELAQNALEEIKDKTQIAGTLLAFARHQSTAGDQESARDDLEEAFEILEGQQEKETRDSRARNSIWTAIAVQFAGFGDAERGLEIARQNIDDREAAKAIAEIAQILAATGSIDKAREAALSMEEPYDQAETLMAIIDTLSANGKAEAIPELLGEAEAIAESVPQVSARADLLIEAAKRQKALGQPGASETIAKAISAISEIRDESRRVTAISLLSAAGAKTDELSPASHETLLRLIGAAEA